MGLKERIRYYAPRGLLRKLRATWTGHLAWCQQRAAFRAQRSDFLSRGGSRRFEVGPDFPCLGDSNASIPFEPHYFYHPAWACRVLREIAPRHHVDISSIVGFAGMFSAFCPTTYYEYQPPEITLADLTVGKVDLSALPFASGSLPSLSCMHVIEHIGLGRYGDALDADGDVRAARELARVLAPGGHFLLVTPMAEVPRLEFNAHRVYSYRAVLDLFPDLVVREFALVQDGHRRGLIRHADPSLLAGQRFACGCFHFVRPAQ
jgi:SAM-dependent methyltransferase